MKLMNRKTIDIVVNRDSVCMGDDCLDHRKKYKLSKEATYTDLFSLIKEDKYLPSISGNDVVWVLKNSEYPCIFSYITFDDKIVKNVEEESLYLICKNDKNLTFKYFCDKESWREYMDSLSGVSGYYEEI